MVLLDIEIPSFDDMDTMTLEQLESWKKKLGYYYSKRFEMNQEDYMRSMRYLAFSMMIENIENGFDKWTRIDRSKMKS